MSKICYVSPSLPIYFGESLSDLALMPTSTKIGEGQYIHALTPVGSYAFILTTTELKMFKLRSTGWVDITQEGGGGGGGVYPAGSITFNQLPALSTDIIGAMFDITDSFTTDSRFREGAGTPYPAGTNVVVINVGTAESPVAKYDTYAGATPMWIGTTAELEQELDSIPEGYLIVVTDGATQTGVPVNYDLIANQPSINGNVLTGNQTSTELGFINDSTAANQSTYSSNKIDELISGAGAAKQTYVSAQPLDETAAGDFWATQLTSLAVVDELYIYDNGAWTALPFEYKEGSPPSDPTTGLYWAIIGGGELRSIYQWNGTTWIDKSTGHNLFKSDKYAPQLGDSWVKINNDTDKAALALYSLSADGWQEDYIFGGVISLGDGLEYDANGRLCVKLGEAMSFDSNGGITTNPVVNVEYGLIYSGS